MDALTDAERSAWRQHGFFIRRGFVDESVTGPMLEDVVELCRRADAGEDVAPALVLPEVHAEGVSKVFRLHRRPVFAEFVRRPDVLALVADLLGDDLDVFLSQFIFKVPGAYGQPWHQDSYYFPFTPDHQLGVWLAVSEATLENGCLWVLPGTQTEPVHEHVRDRRPDSQYGYVEIVDHDMSAAEPVLMAPGDLLIFDSHVMHRSTDNDSDDIRAAMVFHFSPAGTVDRARRESPVNDWVPVRRSGQAVA
jgi:phytanoyl-CoA hydroxylase